MVLGLFEGKMEVIPDRRSYLPGEVIHGKVRLAVDKPQEARELRLEFYGEVKQFQGRGTITVQINHQLICLDGKRTYLGISEYPFEVKIPKDAMPPKPKDMMGKAMEFIKSKPKYFLSASLDMELKFDISTCVPIDVLRP